jgi:hypothetical protein
MFKNISRKQKLIDEKDRTKEKAQTSLVLFNSKFIAELNQDLSQDKINIPNEVIL